MEKGVIMACNENVNRDDEMLIHVEREEVIKLIIIYYSLFCK